MRRACWYAGSINATSSMSSLLMILRERLAMLTAWSEMRSRLWVTFMDATTRRRSEANG